MPFTDVTEIAHSAIETAITFLVGESDIGEVDVLRLFEALQSDLRNISEAKTKTIDGKARPAGDFLVVGSADEPGTWHLPVKVNGKVDRRLMGGAKAALTAPGGNRGNPYAGPDKAGATKRLKAMYKAEDMEWTEAAQPESVRELLQQARDLQERALELLDETVAMEVQNVTNFNLNVTTGEDTTSVADDFATMEEAAKGIGELHADGVAVEVARDATEADLSEVQAATESGRRAPVVVDFRILKPGPGNKKHKRYYPRDVLKRDIHVFNEVDVYATDHVHKERNEETKVGKVLKCPAYFMEDGSPIARTLIYDPYQAEKARNRADAEALSTLQCSIFGKGRAAPGDVGGKKYSVVQEMTRGLYLDLVSSGGAGGQAQNLVESENGGDAMTDNEDKTTPTDDANVQEVDIEESEAGPEAGETPQPLLESEAVETALAETKLPSAFKAALSKVDYADEDALKEAINTAIAEVKKLTRSGQVQDLGETSPPQPERPTVEQLEERAAERYNDRKRRFGM